MKAATPRRRWKVGDTFRVNRYVELADGTRIEGALFTVVSLARGYIYFRSDYDRPQDRDRKMRRARFLAELRRRELVRVP